MRALACSGPALQALFCAAGGQMYTPEQLAGLLRTVAVGFTVPLASEAGGVGGGVSIAAGGAADAAAALATGQLNKAQAKAARAKVKAAANRQQSPGGGNKGIGAGLPSEPCEDAHCAMRQLAQDWLGVQTGAALVNPQPPGARPPQEVGQVLLQVLRESVPPPQQAQFPGVF
jgi:hypothetical protein